MNEREIFEILKVAAAREIRALGPAIRDFSFFGWNHSPARMKVKKAA